MKKLLKTLILFIVVYFVLNFAIQFFSKGHTIHYSIVKQNQEVEVTETYKRRMKKVLNHYYLKFQIGKDTFTYQTMENFNDKKKIVEDVFYVKDGAISCFLPVFSGKQILTDIMCKENATVYYHYSDIKNPSIKLREFQNLVRKNGYQLKQFQDQTEYRKRMSTISVYRNNLADDMLVGITYYKGLYGIYGDEIKNIRLFDHDVYTRKLSAFVGKYYFTANYNQQYDFQSFYLVDLVTGEKEEVKTKYEIPSDAYITGVVEDSVYLVDRLEKKQYQFSTISKTLREIGNEKQGMQFYENGKFETVPATRLTLKERYFDTEQLEIEDDYVVLQKMPYQKSGYNYYYKKEADQYKIYRSDRQNLKNKLYLFTTKNIDDVYITDRYIYYREGNTIKCYQDAFGVRSILTDTEFEFNPDIKYGAFEK